MTLLKNTSLGPVVGAVIITVMFIAAGVYFYRRNLRARPSLDPGVSQEACGINNQQAEHEGYLYHQLPVLPGPSNQPPAAAAGDQSNNLL